MNRSTLTPGSELPPYIIEEVMRQDGFGVTYIAALKTAGPEERRYQLREFYPEELVTRRFSKVFSRRQNELDGFAGLRGKCGEMFQRLASLKVEGFLNPVASLSKNNTRYLVSPWTELQTLGELQAEMGRFSAEDVRSLFEALRAAFWALHDAGIVHADVSPDTIMRSVEAGACLACPESPALIGEPPLVTRQAEDVTAFTAPELSGDHSAEPLMAAADVYSFSALAFWLLTGELPAYAAERLAAVEQGQADPLNLAALSALKDEDPALYRAIATGLVLTPEERCADFDAFEAILAGEDPAAEPDIAFVPAADLPIEVMEAPVTAYEDANRAEFHFPGDEKWFGGRVGKWAMVASWGAIACLGALILLPGKVGPFDNVISQRASFEDAVIRTPEETGASAPSTPPGPGKAELERVAAEERAAAEAERKRAADQAFTTQDEASWQEADAANTIPAYEAYLANARDDDGRRGAYVRDARKAINALEQAQAEREDRARLLLAELGYMAEPDEDDIGFQARLAVFADNAGLSKPSKVTDDLLDAMAAQIEAQANGPEQETIPGSDGLPFRDCETCPELMLLDPDIATNGPDRLAMMAFEVTVGEFERFLTETGISAPDYCAVHSTEKPGNWLIQAGAGFRNPGFEQKEDFPAVCVSHDHAVRFADWLSRKTGEVYRLPSRAEWAAAARAKAGEMPWRADAGRACEFANGGDQALESATRAGWRANSCNDGHAFAAPVGSFPANDAGLYDMSGNVWEWVSDCTGAGNARRCELRGGSWANPAGQLGPDSIYSAPAGTRLGSAGFRLVRVVRASPDS